jgi:hypothetical protein
MSGNFQPHNIEGIIALIRAVDGDMSRLSTGQVQTIRRILHLDDPRTVAERTGQAVTDDELSTFLLEVGSRAVTSPWLLQRGQWLYRNGTDDQRKQILDALSPILGNDFVRKFITGGIRYD